MATERVQCVTLIREAFATICYDLAPPGLDVRNQVSPCVAMLTGLWAIQCETVTRLRLQLVVSNTTAVVIHALGECHTINGQQQPGLNFRGHTFEVCGASVPPTRIL